MQLPFSDELNIGYLSRLFDNTTNCYKFFWFQSIIKNIDENHRTFVFDDLIDEMIINAWYMVTEYHLRLGPIGSTDNLEELVKYIHEKYGFHSAEKAQNLMTFLKKTDDKKIRGYKNKLIQNVPYHLQQPFIDEVIIPRRMWSGSKKILSETMNRQGRMLYYYSLFAGLDTRIEITPSWAPYLEKHREILKAWSQLKLIQYLQNRNPSVPGIADKIEPPSTRDINRVRSYWKTIISVDPSLRDIYGNTVLAEEAISVDHFVPWQYVAHDELWNLHPTTRGINSSKNNSLPSWERYFDALGEIEYRANELRASAEIVRKEYEKIAPYHLNNQEIKKQLYEEELSKNEFKIRLCNVIKPIYDAAKMQGFKEWNYDSYN